MGIYGAMSTAVAGLQAQSLALENISGNIANVQTSGYKRMETSFSELVPGATMANKGPSSVQATGRQTVSVQGSISSSDVGTHMAITGDGFFNVRAKTGSQDGLPQLSAQPLYTRRGDFEFDANGFLVNGSGYYLTGFELDKVTGEATGADVAPIKVGRDFIPAQPTTKVSLRANLPTVPNVENVNPATAATTSFALSTADAQAVTIGNYTKTFAAAASDATVIAAFEADTGFDAAYSITSDGAGNFTVTSKNPGAETAPGISNAAAATFTLDTTAGQDLTIGGTTLTLGAGDSDAAVIAAFQGDGAFNAAYSITSDGAGNFTVVSRTTGAGTGPAVSSTVGAQLTAVTAYSPSGNSASGVTAANGTPSETVTTMDANLVTTPGSGPNVINANDNTEFLEQTVAGGSITVRNSNGEPVNLQMRWAKMSDTPHTWNLFYMSDSTATGANPMWEQIGGNYTFDAAGKLTSVTSSTVNNLRIDGVTVGSVLFDHGAGGLTQFADPNGLVRTTDLSQNGYAAGELVEVGISESGRVTASYSNGQSYDLYEIPLSTFNAPNRLQGLDGSAYAATFESGSAVLGASGSVKGSAIEGSNTDIADEFTKLIVTQQAYSAGTRIVTTSDEMMQEALNMKR